jgi:TorA maturation chaperone TorD
MDRSLARSLVYNMLAICYVYPDRNVYSSIAEGKWITGFKNALHLLDEENFDACLRAIKQAISGTNEDEQQAMACEYTRLFIGASPHAIAPLYGSLFLGKRGLNSGETTSEVLRFYHESGEFSVSMHSSLGSRFL